MQELDYGAWPSPITASLIAQGGRRLSGLQAVGDTLYWLETRLEERGQRAIMRCKSTGLPECVTGVDTSVRTRVHEYGCGEYLASAQGLFYADDVSKTWYWRQNDGQEQMLFPAQAHVHYADPCLTETHLLLVRETHGDGVINELVAVDLASFELQVIASGADFYAYPRVSPDQKQLAWIAWHHPQMPWDGTELWVADLADNAELTNQKKVAGSAKESIFQPQWHNNGRLFYVSDRSGFWNLYSDSQGETIHELDLPLEFGLPLWNFAMRTYAFVGEDKVALVGNEKGCESLYLLDLNTKTHQVVPGPWCAFSATMIAYQQGVAFIGAERAALPEVVTLNLEAGSVAVIRQENEAVLDKAYLSTPEMMTFSDADNTTYGFYYPPKNKDYQSAGKPPLLVFTHSGPTACANPALALKIQYWTSRGFAVVDVNYGGSTGFGKAYRARLDANWGKVDLADVETAVNVLIKQGLVDPDKILIRGSSAGGYTTLAALTFTNQFAAGASYYGIGDLVTLAQETHKFELEYTNQLVGPYPEHLDVYKQRSPQYHLDQLNSPVILLQGLEDKVVVPGQARAIVEALAEKGLPYAYIEYPGEGHGFRQADTVIHSLESELSFYRQVLGLENLEEITPVKIENINVKELEQPK